MCTSFGHGSARIEGLRHRREQPTVSDGLYRVYTTTDPPPAATVLLMLWTIPLSPVVCSRTLGRSSG
jgi:hypothetical protein